MHCSLSPDRETINFLPTRRATKSLNGNDTDPMRRAMTLVEVIAGLTLLATIGIGSMMAFSAHQRQITTARETLLAVQLADGLLSRWAGASMDVPVLQSGGFDQAEWFWQTQPVRAETIAGLAVQIVRFDVYRRDRTGVMHRRSSVEVMVPLPLPEGGGA